MAALFTEGATYASHPLQAPHQGRDAAEWWATMRDGDWAARQGAEEDDRLTLPGCLVLRFAADGPCEELREYWNVGFGQPTHPSEGWGQ